MDSHIILRATKMIDGTGHDPVDDPIIIVKGNTIWKVGIQGDIDLTEYQDAQKIWLDGCTLLPGLIDSHVHLALGTRGSYDVMMEESDGVQLITGVINAREALHAGITTMKEAGVRNRVAYDLKSAMEAGLIEAPRLLVSGRPITVPGGHFHFCNDNEASSVEEARWRVNQLAEEGADFIKIMASGGGTRGTNNREASFNEETLKAIVDEAHKLGRITSAHCEAYESVGNAVRAGVDILEHCGFIMSDGSRGFDEEIVKIMVEKGLYYDPTIQTGSQLRDDLRAKKERGLKLTDNEEIAFKNAEYKIRRKSENLMLMIGLGVKVVAGSDGIGLGNSVRLIRAMEIMAEAGMTPLEVITAATYEGARALKLGHKFGSIKKGLLADIIAVDGDPSLDISHLRNPRMVMQEGNVVYYKESSAC
jgi:imidazolonepropionase-like amidohydrolase